MGHPLPSHPFHSHFAPSGDFECRWARSLLYSHPPCEVLFDLSVPNARVSVSVLVVVLLCLGTSLTKRLARSTMDEQEPSSNSRLSPQIYSETSPRLREHNIEDNSSNDTSFFPPTPITMTLPLSFRVASARCVPVPVCLCGCQHHGPQALWLCHTGSSSLLLPWLRLLKMRLSVPNADSPICSRHRCSYHRPP